MASRRKPAGRRVKATPGPPPIRAAARRGEGDWLGAALRRTWLPVLLTVLTFTAAGYLLQRAAPRARSIGEAWKMVNSD